MQKRNKYQKHSIELKKRAGELARKGYSVKEIAEELGVNKSTANYLEWSGKILLGVPFTKRKPHHKHFRHQEFNLMDFENEVYPVPQRARWTMYIILFCVLLALFSPLINKLVGAWAGV